MKKCLISACIAGLCTRYDGRSTYDSACMTRLAGTCWIPVCPEQLGGLPTPRIGADLSGGDGYSVIAGQAKVINRQHIDVTKQFVRGARQVLAIARAQNIRLALLKKGSPSCGLSPRAGVTTALLRKNHIDIIEI